MRLTCKDGSNYFSRCRRPATFCQSCLARFPMEDDVWGSVDRHAAVYLIGAKLSEPTWQGWWFSSSPVVVNRRVRLLGSIIFILFFYLYSLGMTKKYRSSQLLVSYCWELSSNVTEIRSQDHFKLQNKPRGNWHRVVQLT